MSLYKRGRIYWCKWEIGGKRVRETTGSEDPIEAQEWHDRRRSDLWREAKLGDTPVQTWDQAALDWVDEHAQHKKSYETDRTRLVWLTKELSGTPLPSINTDTLLSLRKKQLDSGNVPATANRFLAVVSAVLNYAHAKGSIPGVPPIPYLPEDSKDIFLWITREQAIALIAELPPHLAAMTRFDLACGLRRANVTHLQWKNVDMERAVAWVWSRDAKGNRHITVPLNDDAMAVLREQAGKHKDFVFTYKDKPVLNTTTKAWYKATARAGIDTGFTFHDLRHTWASWHVMGGTPLEVLQQLGAWKSLDMVQRYAHLAPGYIAKYAGNSSLNTGTISAT